MKVQKVRGAPRESAPDHLNFLFTRTKMNENELARKLQLTSLCLQSERQRRVQAQKYRRILFQRKRMIPFRRYKKVWKLIHTFNNFFKKFLIQLLIKVSFSF